MTYGTEAQGTAPVEEAPEVTKPTDPKAQKQGDSQPSKAKESGPPPWAKDLDERGINSPEIDSYLREVWQPRMTQHEQSLSEWEGLFGDGGMEAAKIGAGLLEALESDPEGTYRQIGELLGLTETEVKELAAEGDDGPESAEPEAAVDPRQEYIDRLMQQEEDQRQDAQYQTLVDSLSQQFENFDEDLFNICILAHEGDLQSALQAYQSYAPAAPTKEEAPPTLGEATPTPREAQDFGSIGESIDAFLSDEKARRGR